MLRRTVPLLLASLLLWTAPAWAVSTVGTPVTAKVDASGTTIASPAITLTAGQGAKICVKWEGNVTLSSITSSTGDTVTLQTAQQHSSLEPWRRCGHVLIASAGSTVFTGTTSGASTYRRIFVYPISYNGTLSLDVTAAASTENNALTTVTSAAVTTTGTDEVCFGFIADYTTEAFSNITINGVTADGSSAQSDSMLFYKIFTGTFVAGTASLTRTSAERWVMGLDCYKTTGGGAGPPPPTTGTVYYVSLTGTNTSCAAASTITTPARTFAFVKACMTVAGDTMYIRSGTYAEQLDIRNKAGAPGAPLIFAGYPGERPCLTNKTGQGGFAIYGPYEGLNSYLTIRNLLLDPTCDGTAINGAGTTDGGGWTLGNTNGAPPDHILIDDVEIRYWKGIGIQTAQGASNITIRNSRIHDLQTTYNGGNGANGCSDTLINSDGRWYGIYMNDSTNIVIENNEIYNNPGGGIHGYPGPNIGGIIRGNYVHDNNQCTNAVFGGIVLQSGSGSQITNGVQVYNNVIVNNGSDARSGNSFGIQVAAGAINSKIYNNTVYGNKNAGIDLFNSSITGTIITNNLVVGNNGGGTQIHDASGGAATLTTNRTTGTITDCTVSTSNFTQKAGSSCINQGTAISGFPFNVLSGKTKPDQGRYETFGFSNATITGNTMLVTVGENIPTNNPILPATGMTGWTVNNGRTVTAAIRQASSDSVVQLTISGGACADSDTWTVTYAPGNVTDTPGQPMTAFSAQPVTNINCSGGTPPTAVVTQANHQFLDAFYQTGTTTVVPLSAVGATTTTIHSGIPFTVALQTDCTIADCPPLGQRLYYRLTPLATGTPGSFTLVPDTIGTDQIAFYGTTADPTVLNGATPATCLSGALTPTAGFTLQTSTAVPVFDLPLNGCTVNRYVLQFGGFAVLGDVYEFIVKNQTTALFDSYVPAGGAKITITPVAGNSAPTGLHEVGAASNTNVQLIWTPIVSSNFMSYQVYQSSTSGVPGVLVQRITATSAAARQSSMTQFMTVLPVAGTYYYTVTWTDTGGQESPVSNEVAVTRTGFVARGVRTP